MALSDETQRILKIALTDEDAKAEIATELVRLDTAAAVTGAVEADATDLAEALLLVNELKGVVNALIAALA